MSGLKNFGLLGLALCLAILSGCAVVQPALPTGKGETADALTTAQPAAAPSEPVLRGVAVAEAHKLNLLERNEFLRAVELLKAGQAEPALPLLERLSQSENVVTAVYIDLAKAYQLTEQKEKAEEALKKAIKLIPGHPLVSHEYGLLLRRAGRFEEARSLYQEALSYYPDYLPIRKNLGILCDIYLNDQDCALEQFTYYSQALPDDEQVKLWVSELQLR